MFELKLLEFSKILNTLSSLSKIRINKENFLALTPSTDKDLIISRLNEADDALNIIYRYGPLEIYPFELENVIDRLRISAPLSIGEFLEINKLIMDSSIVNSYFKGSDVLKDEFPHLIKHTSNLRNLKPIRDLIESVLDFEGNVVDSASIELSKIRKTLKHLENEVNSKLNQILKDSASMLTEAIITIRRGHKVVPVKLEYKNRIKGIIYDESSSGQTIYIEPYAISEIQNKITILRNDEENEIKKILLKLSSDVSMYYEDIYANYNIILNLDEIFSRGEYAKLIDGTIPIIGEELNYINARHPLINKDECVPNTITLLNNKKTMIITGPNTGGKTVVLKTVGLLSVMLQAGLLIPVKEGSTATIFNGIYADIGDEQSIEQSLSTFSSHMKRISFIMNNVENHSLVLFDELGSGTDPKEGASLAIAILDYIRKKDIFSITTTHYSELKFYAYNNLDTVNASVEFDVNTLKPTYKLLSGVSGGSNAFLISSRLGLKDEIIENAKKVNLDFTSEESNLIKKLESDSKDIIKLKDEYESKIKELDIKFKDNKEYLRNEREKLNKKQKDIENERVKILADAQDEANLLLDEIKELKKDILKKKEVKEDRIAKLRGDANAIYKDRIITHKKPKGELHVGDNVNVIEYNKVGLITAIKNNKYTVSLGSLNQIFNREDLEYVEVVDYTKSIINEKKNYNHSLKTNVSKRLDLRGMRYEEALDALDKFIDDALYASLDSVEVIHGYGTLALRNMVIDYAKSHKEIKGYRSGEEHEGGRGVTVITLK